ncbi:hypothetical protein F5876DRAFT_66939 [Lentinula aff. lateritia]|uniref:Uncharacterized protein n=1 Tax=Lentinula aff. lateritia TaxID=2804960 RepID=A0ACC1TWX7_9AGAR|nr:hypothetical protein F5876DRAFT_66939 [Lentinula aff. lateritia]
MDLKLIRCRRIKAFHQIYRYHPGPLECMSGDEAGMDGKYYKTQRLVYGRYLDHGKYYSPGELPHPRYPLNRADMVMQADAASLQLPINWYNLAWLAEYQERRNILSPLRTAVSLESPGDIARTSAFYISILKLSLSTLQLCFKTLLLERLLGHRFEKRIVRRMTLQDLALQTIRGSSCPRFLHDQTMPAHHTDRPKKRFHPYLRRGKFLRNRPDHGVQQQFHALAFFMFIGLILSLDGPALRLTTPRSLVYARFQCIENVGTFTSPLLLPERYKARPAPSFIDSKL